MTYTLNILTLMVPNKRVDPIITSQKRACKIVRKKGSINGLFSYS